MQEQQVMHVTVMGGVILGLYWANNREYQGYNGIMEKKMETTI